MSQVRFFGVVCVAMCLLWLAFATLMGPSIIESAYRGESLPALNALIRYQSENSLDYYLEKWNRLTIYGLIGLVAFWMVVIVTTSPSYFRRFVGEATPGTLGAIRAWTCAILLMTTIWEDLSSFALLPKELREPMGLMNLLYQAPIGYEQFLASELALRTFQWVTQLLLFLGMIGWRTRLVIPLATVCAFVLNGILREYSGFWHQNLVPIYVLAVLSFTPCDHGWSVDRLRRIFQGRPVPESESRSALYGWARYVCWVPIAMTYAAAGLTKLRSDGFDWVSATNMRHLLYEQTLYPRAGNWSISLYLAPAPDIVFNLLGLAAICGELFFVIVLVSRIARRIFPAIQIMMHVGIVFLQNIVFFDLMLLLLIFYDFTNVRKAVARRLAARGGPVEVFYDGYCPLCRRTIRVLGALDLFERLVFTDFRRSDVTERYRRHGLTPAALQTEMYVIARGRAYRGFRGYRVLALRLPALWVLAPWLFLPGISTAGEAVYGYVARHRLNHLSCDASCPIEPSEGAVVTVPRPDRSARYGLVYGFAVACVIAGMGFFWVRRIEYYPFTAVPMFTGQNSSMITYFKTLGHRESGETSRIYLEDTIGAVSINSRYETLFSLCFGQEVQVQTCEETLTVLGSAYNKKVPADQKLAAYEIQKWTWDFRAHPSDPDYGSMVETFVFDFRPDRSR